MAWRSVIKPVVKKEQIGIERLRPLLKWKARWQPKWVISQKRWQPKWNKKIWVQNCPLNTEVDTSARYSGIVKSYFKWKGVGFIELEQKGVLPGDTVFVHWSNIQTDDRYPHLVEGMAVEFGLQVWKQLNRDGRKQAHLRAKYVTDIGGDLIAVQDKLDAEKKIFVGGQHLRYSGFLKYYDATEGMGKVTLDDGYVFDDLDVPTVLLVEEAEVNAGGKRPKNMKNVKVEFGIWRNKNGQYKVYNMSLPDGLIMSWENLNGREMASNECFSGTISQWWWKQGWGFIAPHPTSMQKLPALVKTKLHEMQAAARRKVGAGREVPQLLYFHKDDMLKGFDPKKGKDCVFQVYIDEKGAGATNLEST